MAETKNKKFARDEGEVITQLTLKPVPKDQQLYSFWDMWGVWFAAMVVISTPWMGVFGAFIGDWWLAFWMTILAEILSFLPYLIMAPTHQKLGVNNFLFSRRALGIHGSKIFGVFNIVQLIWWNILMFIVGAKGANTAAVILGIPDLYWVWIVIQFTLVVFIVSRGAVGVRWMERIGAPVMLLFAVIVLASMFTSPAFDFATATYVSSDENMLTHGMQFMISPEVYWELIFCYAFGFFMLSGDYNRFAKSGKAAAFGSYIGGVTGCIIFMVMGLAAALGSFIPSAVYATAEYASLYTEVGYDVFYYGDPSSFIAVVAPSFTVFSVLLLLLGVITTNSICLYSASITFMNFYDYPKVLAGKFKYLLIGILAAPMILLCGLGEGFLISIMDLEILFLGGSFGPYCAILVFDTLYYRWRSGKGTWVLDTDAVFDTKGRYRFTGGFNFRGIIAWLVGNLIYALGYALHLSGLGGYTSTPWFGPLGNIVPVFFISGFIYLLLTHYFPAKSLKAKNAY